MRGSNSRPLGFLIVVGLGHCVSTAVGADRAVPNDPAFLCQWGLDNTGQLADCDVPIPAGRIEADIDALGAWSLHTGAKPVIVAVLGQGISEHPEFEQRLLPGFATIGDPYDTRDLGERGSLVAGIIGAGRDNGMGVAGLNDAVRLLPVRVFDANSATTQAAQAQGVRWAVDQGAEIIVVLSQLVTGSDVFAEAIAYAAANDVLILAAAGDDGTGDQVYPAAYAECIGVAATTNTDARAPFSNSGPHVDLAAPGELVYSTTPAGEYATKWGTALAAGYVAGAASLIRSYAPQLTALEVRAILEDSADDLPPVGWDEQFGHGRLNAARALADAPPPPLRFEFREMPPTLLTPAQSTTISVAIADGSETLLPDSGMLAYRIDADPFTTMPLTSLGAGLFSVQLPPAPCGSIVAYYFQAEGTVGAVVVDPPGAPAETYTAKATLSQFIFEDDFEHPLGWTTTIEDGANPAGAWVRADPVGTVGGLPPVQAQPEYDRSANAGHQCFFTGQHGSGGFWETDVDGPPVRLTSPMIPIDSPDAEITFAAWLSSTGGEEHVPDLMQVGLSRDDGESWTTVEFIGHTDGWRPHGFLLSDFAGVTGDRLRVRFSVADEPNNSLTEAAVDDFSVRAILCAAGLGDIDGDGRLTLLDHRFLADCLTGPGNSMAGAACAVFDLDHDDDVDLQDAAAFQGRFTASD